MLTPHPLADINAQEYSAFEHLRSALFWADEDLIAVLTPLTMYCDASGKKTGELVTVGGFVSPVSKWAAFEGAWRGVLNPLGIQCFHMREFAHSVGQFKDWKSKEQERQKLLED